MENEIKVNEYVRTNRGYIYQFTDDIKDDIQMQDFILCNMGKPIKHSENIIDLIKVDDYVNGHLVVDKYIDIDDYGKDFICIEVESDLMLHKCLYEKHIRTIVTKEMMESISYKVKQEENQKIF